jgi:hypothetical protein
LNRRSQTERRGETTATHREMLMTVGSKITNALGIWCLWCVIPGELANAVDMDSLGVVLL